MIAPGSAASRKLATICLGCFASVCAIALYQHSPSSSVGMSWRSICSRKMLPRARCGRRCVRLLRLGCARGVRRCVRLLRMSCLSVSQSIASGDSWYVPSSVWFHAVIVGCSFSLVVVHTWHCHVSETFICKQSGCAESVHDVQCSAFVLVILVHFRHMCVWCFCHAS